MMHRIVALIVATRLARVRTVTWSRSGWKNCNNWVSKDPERRCAKESDDGIPAQRVCPQCRNETLPPRPTPPPRPRPTPAPVVPPPVLSPGAPPPCAVDERDRGCAFEWVPLETREEWDLYWPNEDDRCHMLARNESEQRRCGAHPSVIRGYACSMDEAGLYFPFRRRLGLRTRPKRLPANRSVQSELGARLGDRALLYLGDSVSNEMKTLLLDRNEDLKRLAPGGGFLNFRRTDADALFGQVAYAAEADRDLGAYERKMVEFLDESYRDVVYIFNVGLHEESQPELYARTLRGLFPVVDRLGGAVYARGARLVPIFLDSSIQHFYSVNGGYTSPRLAFERLADYEGCDRGLDRAVRSLARPGNRKFSYRCAPSHMRAEYASCQTFGGSRVNKIARVEWERGNYTNIRFLPFGAATDALWDAHIGMSKQDCTHFCFFPALAELWSYLVLKALDAVDSGDAAAVRAFDAWDWR